MHSVCRIFLRQALYLTSMHSHQISFPVVQVSVPQSATAAPMMVLPGVSIASPSSMTGEGVATVAVNNGIPSTRAMKSKPLLSGEKKEKGKHSYNRASDPHALHAIPPRVLSAFSPSSLSLACSSWMPSWMPVHDLAFLLSYIMVCAQAYERLDEAFLVLNPVSKESMKTEKGKKKARKNSRKIWRAAVNEGPVLPLCNSNCMSAIR